MLSDGSERDGSDEGSQQQLNRGGEVVMSTTGLLSIGIQNKIFPTFLHRAAGCTGRWAVGVWSAHGGGWVLAGAAQLQACGLSAFLLAAVHKN